MAKATLPVILVTAVGLTATALASPRGAPHTPETPPEVRTPADPRSTTVTVLLPGRVPLVLVRVPAGTFTMGSPTTERGRRDDEAPHQVTLTRDYLIGRTEVTQAQWEALSGNSASGSAAPVGRKRANPFGLHDVHGNVREWGLDWYAPYDTSAQTDPTGPAGGVTRVIRGGRNDYPAWFCRSACRSLDPPATRDGHTGLRVAASI